MNSTSNLVEFLHARLAEDKERARRWQAKRDVGPFDVTGGFEPGYVHVHVGDRELPPMTGEELHERFYDEVEPDARVLAEVEAKRRIIEHHMPRLDLQVFEPQVCPICYYESSHDELYPCPTLRLLALPYADHPDYRQEWAP